MPDDLVGPRCPYCGTEMIEGEAFVRGTLLGFLIIGLSHQHLWFRRRGQSKTETIIETSDSRAGHQCPKYGAVAINRFRRQW